jgi:hypothetical protein
MEASSQENGGFRIRHGPFDELALLGDFRREEVEEHPDARGLAQIGMGEKPEIRRELGIGWTEPDKA